MQWNPDEWCKLIYTSLISLASFSIKFFWKNDNFFYSNPSTQLSVENKFVWLGIFLFHMAYYVETNHWICSVLNWVRFRQMQRPPTFWGPSGLHFGGLYFFLKVGKIVWIVRYKLSRSCFAKHYVLNSIRIDLLNCFLI